LLLEIEWFTYDEYLEYIEEQKNWYIEYPKSDEYMQMSDTDKKNYDGYYTPECIEDIIKGKEYRLNKIKTQEWYVARTINGNYYPGGVEYEAKDMWKYIDSNGYFIFKVYPFAPHLGYYDENNEFQFKQFIKVYDKEEYDNLLKKYIIPYCEELVERGLVSQEYCDYFTTFDPLDHYVNKLFN
jgi:hypothetical protein